MITIWIINQLSNSEKTIIDFIEVNINDFKEKNINTVEAQDYYNNNIDQYTEEESRKINL